MAEVRGTFDLVFDKIIDALVAYEAEEILVDATYAFTVEADYFRDFPADAGAYVFAYLGPITFDARTSAAMTQHGINVTYYLDLVTVAKGDDSGASYQRGDELAAARNRYLIQQVMTALYRPGVLPDFGLPAGTIGKRPAPRVEPLQPDDQRKIERPVSGTRITMDMDMAWDPTEAEGTALESVSVDAGYFAALYEIGG